MPIDNLRFAVEATQTIVNVAQRAKSVESKIRNVRSVIRLAHSDIESGYGSLTLSDIPSDYSHLILEVSCRSDKNATSDTLFIRLNGDSGSNYQYIAIKQYASSVAYIEGLGATGAYIGDVPGATATANFMGGFTAHIYDSQSALYKTIRGYGSLMTGLTTGLINTYDSTGVWKDTDPITSVTIVLGSGEFITGGKVSLYGEP